MTPEERTKIEAKVNALVERVEDLENEREAIKNLPGAVARLQGAVDVLHDLALTRFDDISKSVEKAPGWDTILKFSMGVIVPLLVALIGGYFALKAGLATRVK